VWHKLDTKVLRNGQITVLQGGSCAGDWDKGQAVRHHPDTGPSLLWCGGAMCISLAY
jgi:hypothetical protein